MSTIEFNAEFVEATEEEFTPEFKVVGIHFGEGDPENGGQHWNFTQSISSEDEDLCVVKEIQQITMYGGIEKFELSPTKIVCIFNSEGAEATGSSSLIINISVAPSKLRSLVAVANKVFKGRGYYVVNNI